MSDLRYDPIFDLWIAVARNRFGRPVEFRQQEVIESRILCPFCIGNEEETPAARAVYQEDGSLADVDDFSVRWLVRVVPNKFPAFSNLSEKDDPALTSDVGADDLSPVILGPYQHSQARGAQEVIICSPRHISSICQLNDDELLMSFQAFQDRVRVMEQNNGIKHTMLFLNCGANAGASLSHIHGQLIGSPMVNRNVMDRLQRCLAYQQTMGESMLDACVHWEVEQKRRLIYQSEHFTVFCPFASRAPLQVWLVPRHSKHQFTSIPEEMRNELARSCRWLIEKIGLMIENPAYNLLLHQAPVDCTENDHWFFEILPRLTHQAGYEHGTGIWVNPVPPETAARRLQFK